MNEFTNNPIDINQLPKFEEVQLKGLNPKYITVLLFNFSLLLILVIGGFSTLFYFKEEAFSNTIWMAIAVGIVLFLAVSRLASCMNAQNLKLKTCKQKLTH